jgi:hypothetical protein
MGSLDRFLLNNALAYYNAGVAAVNSKVGGIGPWIDPRTRLPVFGIFEDTSLCPHYGNL